MIKKRMLIPVLYLYTILAYMVLYPFTFFNTLTILLLNILGLYGAIHRVIGFWAKGSFFIIGKSFSIENEKNIKSGKNYILMANHASLFDIMGVMAIYPNVSWFGREYLLKIPVFGSLLRAINYIPMRSADIRNTKRMVEELMSKTKGKTIAIFPEGTRTLNGEINKFRKGFLYVQRAGQQDILPVSLIGFYKFKPKNRFYFNYFEKLSAKIHSPIPYAELEKLSDKEIIDTVQAKIKSEIF